MRQSFFDRWKLGLLTLALIAALFAFLRTRERPLEISDIVDEGGAAKSLQLRLKVKPGARFRLVSRTLASVPAQRKTSIFENTGETRITDVSGDQFSSETTFGQTTAVQDDLNMESWFNSQSEKPLRFTYDTRSRLLKASRWEEQASFNFPLQAVSAGAEWTGFETRNGKRRKLSFTIERFVKYRGHDVAVIRRNYPASEHHSATDWLDVTAGTFIKGRDEMSQLAPGGMRVDVRIDAQSSP